MINLQDITLLRGTKRLLDQASVTIHPAEKVALIGRNGIGKSSLFALLTGQLHEDAGQLSIPTGWRVAQVDQAMPESDQSATDFVLSGDTQLGQLKQQLAAAERSADGMAIAQAHSDLADAGAHDARARAEAMILGLGFQSNELTQAIRQFSGGWRMRLQLARALMAPSDLLLLDEPSNHLDLDALVWLEGWLSRYRGTLIVISHDREFLDAVAQTTLHIENEKIARYRGNYSQFEAQHAARLALQQSRHAKQQDQMAQLQKFIDRFKAKATKARQAQSRVKALQRMEKVAPVLLEAQFQFEFEPPDRLPNPMLSIRNGVFGYATPQESAADGHIILDEVNRTILPGQRIGVLGANGQGKSTFIKTVATTLPALAGDMIFGKGLSIGYFAQQEMDVLRPDETPLQHMQQLARDTGRADSVDAREQALRNVLGRFHFPADMATQPVGQFSGGEKARLVLAMIVWQRPNLLLLDEPTNHLDLITREALAMALNGFDGTLLVVSHDRALLRSVCDEFWLVANGDIHDFDGSIDDYQRMLRERYFSSATDKVLADSPQSESAPTPAANRADQRRERALQRQQLAASTRQLRQAMEKAEKRLDQIETERHALEQCLSAPDIQPEDIADYGKQLKVLSQEHEKLEKDWLAQSTQLDDIQAQA